MAVGPIASLPSTCVVGNLEDVASASLTVTGNADAVAHL